MTVTAAAALDLSGRYAGPGRQAADGLRAWAGWAGARLVVEDATDDAGAHAALARELAPSCDLFFGPYGSGPMRAVARAGAGAGWVCWNHGGAAVGDDDRAGARVVDVLGPARRYWAGLPAVLAAAGADPARVAVLHAPSGFGRETAAGAVDALRAAGARPLVLRAFTAGHAAAAARDALAAGAGCVVGCGRIEDDLALGRALAGAPVAVGLVVCGVGLALEELGDAVEGWFGPAQWWPGAAPPPVPLPPGADYPAAQALAAGLLASAALAAAGTAQPDALWRAALALSTRTFLGPFAVDGSGRQTAHAPVVVRWTRGPGGLRRTVAWAPAG